MSAENEWRSRFALPTPDFQQHWFNLIETIGYYQQHCVQLVGQQEKRANNYTEVCRSYNLPLLDILQARPSWCSSISFLETLMFWYDQVNCECLKKRWTVFVRVIFCADGSLQQQSKPSRRIRSILNGDVRFRVLMVSVTRCLSIKE